MTRTKKYFLLVLTICFCHVIAMYAQNNPQQQIDSLTTVLKTAKEDTNQVRALIKLGNIYRNTDIDKCKIISEKMLLLSEKLNYQKGIAKAIYLQGFIDYSKGDFEKAKEKYTKALNIYEGMKSKTDAGQMIYNLGIIAAYTGDYVLANRNFFKALHVYESVNDNKEISDCYIVIANIYGKMGNDKKELEYHTKALKIKIELNDKCGISSCYLNIGTVNAHLLQYDSALVYSFKAYKIAEEIQNQKWMLSALGNIGAILTIQGKTKEGLGYLLKSLELAQKNGDKEAVATTTNMIGTSYYKIGNFNKAKEYFEQALAIAKSINNKSEISQSYENLASNSAEMKNYEAAYDYHKLFSNIKDSILNENNSDQISEMGTKYETEKKDSEIKLLNKDKQIQSADIKQQKIIIWFGAAGLLIVLFFSFLIFRESKQKQKANIEISKQKEIIAKKNKDITDSINYAKRIQNAMLPHRRDIWFNFPHSFVLFKPKDIVSGDFYFFHKTNRLSFIGAVDCTGHGVPGAFMSMIGAGNLNNAVSQSYDTSEILSILNKGIKTALKQTESNESTRDGMDIALCSVDIENRIVKYAGANLPLWIIRKGQTVVEEIKATKTAIGGLTEDNHFFETHEFQFQQGDTFYIFTDGYADQFGGKNGKKLMTKTFKETLLAIQNLPMKEQRNHLDNFIENWKSVAEQVDDILIIGVQL